MTELVKASIVKWEHFAMLARTFLIGGKLYATRNNTSGKLIKTYRVHEKPEGFKNTIKDLFSRTYIEKRAVDDLCFSAKAGEIVGLLGENGAALALYILYVINGVIVLSAFMMLLYSLAFVFIKVGVLFPVASYIAIKTGLKRYTSASS